MGILLYFSVSIGFSNQRHLMTFVCDDFHPMNYRCTRIQQSSGNWVGSSPFDFVFTIVFNK